MKTEARDIMPHFTQTCATNDRFSLPSKDMLKKNILMKTLTKFMDDINS